jgi:hypothetical protein
MESIFELSSSCGGTDDDDTDTFETDGEDSLTSAQSSIVSFECVDSVSVKNSGYCKTTLTAAQGDHDVTSSTRSPTTGGSFPWNVVKRAITVEQGDIGPRLSDSTIEQPVCASSISNLEGEVADDAMLRSTVSTRCGSSPTSKASKPYDNDDEHSVDGSYGEHIQLNVSSPDEEIANLVFVNLAQRRTRKDSETVVLYQCDRLDGPLQLPTRSVVTQRKDEANGNSCETHEDVPTSAEADTFFRSETGSSSPHFFAPGNSRADRACAIDIKVSMKDNDVSMKDNDDGAMPYGRDQFADDDDFPPVDNCEVQIEVDRNNLHPDGVGDLRQPSSTNLELQGTENDGESERATSSADGSIDGSDNVSDSSLDDINKLEDCHDDSTLQDDTVVGGARSVFHPKLIDTKSDCSVSTIGGGYQRESCAGGTHLSKMSFRVLNPPHPICALQALDQISLLAVATQNLSRIHAQRRRPNASFVNDPARRLSFLHCRNT